MVCVFDDVFLYGDGVFEAIRVYCGQSFKCRSHHDRIFRNGRGIYLDQQSPEGRVEDGGNFPYTPDQIRIAMEEAVKANDLTDGYIRLIFSRGAGTLGLNPFACPKPSVVIIADTITLYPEEMYTNGMRVVVAKRPRTPDVCLDPRLKSLNYLNNILAKVEAIDAGCLEAIMLRYTDGDTQVVGECTGDNLFMVKDGIIYTSPLEVGMLDGITRKFLIEELAPSMGFTVREEWLTLDRVMSADEIFLTGTAAEMIAVTQIGETRLSDGEGEITKKLRTRFREIVTQDVVPTD